MTVRGANYPRRKNDDYPTPPEVLDTLFKHVMLGPYVYDPACGKKNRVVFAAERWGLKAHGTDIIHGQDFLKRKTTLHVDVVTNPPFGDRRGTMTLAFIEHALRLTEEARCRVAMLLPVDFDSGKTRAHVFGDCPMFALKLVLLDRIRWFNGVSGSLNHCWCIWDWKHKGPPIIKYARIENGDHVETQGRAHRAGHSARAAGRRAYL